MPEEEAEPVADKGCGADEVDSAPSPAAPCAAQGCAVDDPGNLRKRAAVIKSIKNRGLVIVAGAGVSIHSVGNSEEQKAVAGWVGLLKHGVEYCIKNQRLSQAEADIAYAQIEIGAHGKVDYLIEVAQRIHDSLEAPRGRYMWLEDSIGQLVAAEPRLIRAIQGLGSLVTTLNYDTLIEQVTEWTSIDLSNHEDVTRCIRERNRDVVIHLHGSWKNPESIVLDRLSYEKIKADGEARDRIRTFARDYTMLFIGCGDTVSDPNFKTLLSWAKEELKEAKFRHYYMCRQADEPDLLTKFGSDAFLTSLVYGTNFEDLSPYLESIGDESGTSSSATNPPIVTPSSDNDGATSKAIKPFQIWRFPFQS